MKQKIITSITAILTGYAGYLLSKSNVPVELKDELITLATVAASGIGIWLAGYIGKLLPSND